MTVHSVDVGSENFQRVVLDGSKKAPVIIDFWAPWCAPCRALKPILEKLAAEYAGKFTLAKVNSDENPEIAAQFGVRGIPAVKAVVEGKLVDEFTGALPESQVRAFIERVLPTPSGLALREARTLLEAGQIAAALPILEHALALDPRNEPAKVDKLEALIALQRLADARAVLYDLHPFTLAEARVSALKAKLEFSDEGGDDAVTLIERIRQDAKDLDARLELARHHVRAHDFEPALEQLLEIIRRDRKFGDDIGRRTMLEVFNLLGAGHELVNEYRRKLAAALY